MCTYHRVLHVQTYLLALNDFRPHFIAPLNLGKSSEYSKEFSKMWCLILLTIEIVFTLNKKVLLSQGSIQGSSTRVTKG